MTENTLLIVDDDEPLRMRLARAMEKRGYQVQTAESVATGIQMARSRPPAYAVVDLKLGDGNGLDVVSAIRQARQDARVVMLTGYGNIARSEEHTSELQSLMRISYAVFCLKKKTQHKKIFLNT